MVQRGTWWFFLTYFLVFGPTPHTDMIVSGAKNHQRSIKLAFDRIMNGADRKKSDWEHEADFTKNCVPMKQEDCPSVPSLICEPLDCPVEVQLDCPVEVRQLPQYSNIPTWLPLAAAAASVVGLGLIAALLEKKKKIHSKQLRKLNIQLEEAAQDSVLAKSISDNRSTLLEKEIDDNKVPKNELFKLH